jgi:hypothetical protein
MSKQLQKDEYYLPGDLGTFVLGGNVRNIEHLMKHNDGSVTLTIGMTQYPKPNNNTEDATFEIIQPKQLTNGTDIKN